MWNKFVFLAAFAGITCLMRASIGTILRRIAGARASCICWRKRAPSP